MYYKMNFSISVVVLVLTFFIKFTKQSGLFSYSEICMKLNEGWTREWDNDQKIPYAYDKNEWAAYDDIQSLTEKVNFLKN